MKPVPPPAPLHRAQVLDLKLALAAQAAEATARQEAKVAVLECSRRLFDAAVAVAMAGPWRQWSEEQPVGAVLHVDEERLASTDDPLVLELLELLGLVKSALECAARLGCDLE